MRLSRNRNWGNPQLVDFLVGLSRQATQYGWRGLYIGDMSQPLGGPMVTGHASHQIGLDADIWMLPPPSLHLTAAQREKISSQSVVAQGGIAPSPLWSASHHAILRAAANPVLLSTYASLAGRVARARYMANRLDGDRWRAAMNEHDGILDALLRRDGPGLAALLAQHLRNKRDIIAGAAAP